MRLVLAILALAAAFEAAADTAANFATVTADGSPFTLEDAVGDERVVLFFWASWCPYCKALMPHLQSLKLEYGDELEIVAIHFRDDADGQAFIEGEAYDFTVIPDGGAIARRYGIHATPGVVIPDASLDIRFDLRDLQRRELPDSDEELSHGQKAGFRAPFWAAEIRKALDGLAAGR